MARLRRPRESMVQVPLMAMIMEACKLVASVSRWHIQTGISANLISG